MQPRAVSYVEQSAQFVFEHVRGKVGRCPASRQVVVRKTAGPHDLSAIAIIRRVVQHLKRTVPDDAQQTFGQRIGKRHIVVLREIALHRVHHDVYRPAGCLIGRQRIGALRVHDGKTATSQVAVVSPLELPFFFRDHASAAHLTSGRGDGQYGCHGIAGSRFRFTLEEVPHIALVGQSVGNRLG